MVSGDFTQRNVFQNQKQHRAKPAACRQITAYIQTVKILITSGATREYLDPVRYLTNGSSGKMGRALAVAALDAGHEVVVVSGQVAIEYPRGVKVIGVISTQQMFDATTELFPDSDAIIGAAAPCDFRPKDVSSKKLSKTDFSGTLELVETSDILAAMGKLKRGNQKIIAFALETDDSKKRAIAKLEKKNADYIVLNGPDALESDVTRIEIIAKNGEICKSFSGSKSEAAKIIVSILC